MFSLISDVSEDTLDRIEELVGRLPNIPSVERIGFYRAEGWQGGANFMLEVDIADRAGFDVYKAAPEHRELADVLRPAIKALEHIQVAIDT